MARKIFLSYKYADNSVRPIQGIYDTTARHYVDIIQSLLDDEDHINKGEADNESLNGFKEETIASKLRTKIHDSSITLVLITKNMRIYHQNESDQWIPWEISYSLKEHTRDGRTGLSNGILAVVVPDENGSYRHFLIEDSCQHCKSTTLMTPNTFSIIGENMFNKKEATKSDCTNHYVGNEPHVGDHSYIPYVKWDDFVVNINHHIDTSAERRDRIHEYNIRKTA
jgi:hypothetical protein